MDGRAGKPAQGFPRAIRLLRRAEYEAVYGGGRRRSSPQFSIFFRARRELSNAAQPDRERFSVVEPPDGAISRFGISVKKALGGAVVRNRIRRRIREILRRNRTEIPTGWDIVIHPRSAVAQAEFAVLEAELLRLLRSIRTADLPR